VPLMELVTEPVIHSAQEAVSFAKMLQLLLRCLGAGDANMEKGEMRVEANISVSDTDTLGTKVEIKNLNSFKVVEKAIEYEVARMTKLLEEGKGDEIVQETRGWDENTARTFSQRKKESSDDYRYFPEPDLPKLMLHDLFNLDELKVALPELPWEKKIEFKEKYGLKELDADNFTTSNILWPNYLDDVVNYLFEENRDPKQEVKNRREYSDVEKKIIQLAANYISSDLIGIVKQSEDSVDILRTLFVKITPAKFAKIINMVNEGFIGSRGAKDILAIMATDGGEPDTIATKKGLKQESNADAINAIIDQIIAEHTTVVEEYKAGKEASIQFLIGQGMKLSKGSANPQMLKELFIAKLG